MTVNMDRYNAFLGGVSDTPPRCDICGQECRTVHGLPEAAEIVDPKRPDDQGAPHLLVCHPCAEAHVELLA